MQEENEAAMKDERYPIGRFNPNHTLTGSDRRVLIESIATAPSRLRAALGGLAPQQLDTPYREQGWTLRQVAHHIPDSHLNGYTRFKLALTEEHPTIRPYREAEWALLEDGRNADPEVSLRLLEALHERWVILLGSLSSDQFARKLTHPESGVMSLDIALQLYDWHGSHHIAHITSLRERMSW
jgi:uncharacterized damage-inducible protein DinB